MPWVKYTARLTGKCKTKTVEEYIFHLEPVEDLEEAWDRWLDSKQYWSASGTAVLVDIPPRSIIETTLKKARQQLKIQRRLVKALQETLDNAGS